MESLAISRVTFHSRPTASIGTLVSSGPGVDREDRANGLASFGKCTMKFFLRFVAAVFLTTSMSQLAEGQPRGLGPPNLSASYHIGGQVLDNGGTPARHIRVCAFFEDFDANTPGVVIPCAFSDVNGLFTVGVAKPGKYRIIYDQADQGYWSPYLPFFRAPGARIPEVIVDPAITRTPITVSLLPKNGVLVGKSVDVKTGLPVEAVLFLMCHASDPRVCWSKTVKSAVGSFNIPAPHVPFTLVARAKGFENWSGLSGNENSPITVTAGSTFDLTLFLKRHASATEQAISETEKQPGSHLEAPAQISPADGAVYDHYPRTTKLEWSPVENAASYSVEIDYCRGGRKGCEGPNPLSLPANAPQNGIKGTTYEFNFVGAQPGRWRVWAVDKDGRDGFKSPWRTFVYRQ